MRIRCMKMFHLSEDDDEIILYDMSEKKKVCRKRMKHDTMQMPRRVIVYN